MALHLGQTFRTFEDAKAAVTDECTRAFHPARVDKKEQIKAYNARVSEDSRITALKDDDIFSYRYLVTFQWFRKKLRR